MTTRCEDYPCCGHTDGLGCNWTYTDEARAFDMAHAMCDHAAGVCDAYDDEDGECSDDPEDDCHDDVAWNSAGEARCAWCDLRLPGRDEDYDPSPCCPDPGCGGSPCTFPGYAANH